MRKYLAVVALLFTGVVCEAGLVSRTYTYADGNTITANENNTNENTLYNEINGNISTDNILDATIQNGDIANTQIGVTKFAAVVQSSFTWLTQMGSYRRPVLVFVDANNVDVSSNTGTTNETCVMFPNERRCVTENINTTNKYRRFTVSSTATFVSGTEDSGMAGSYASNNWISFYAVKSQVNTSNFVIAGSTVGPVNSNYSTLNTMFGTNGWVYLGTLLNGDGTGSSTGFKSFRMVGNCVSMSNALAGSSVSTLRGINLASTAGATTLTYTYAVGTTIPSMPPHITTADMAVAHTLGRQDVTNSAATFTYLIISALNDNSILPIPHVDLTLGVKNSATASTAQDISIQSFYDDYLGLGYNP